MTTWRRLAWWLLAAFAAVLAGCKVDAIEPIVPLASAQADPALYGVWRYREQDEVTFVHIGAAFTLGEAKEGQPMRIVVVDHKPSGVTVDDYLAYGARIGRDRYLSIAQDEQGRLQGYLFVRYRIDGGALRFATVDGKALADAIRGGRIEGTVRGDAPFADATITAGSAAIAQWLPGAGRTLFNPPMTLRRVATR